jgi:hypothetical protein
MGGPDQPRTEHCSYCGDKLPTDDEDPSFVPLILWTAQGWCAEFCDHCQAAYWGIQSFDEPVPPRHEIEARAGYRNDAFPERECDRCGKTYRGPAVYCSFGCAIADA